MIDSKNRKYGSLASVREYAALAEGLYELDVFGAILADEYLANGYPEFYGADILPRLKHFITVGTGTGQDENGNYVAIVLVHENSKLAKENVYLLKERIKASWWEFDGTEDGKVVSWQDTITQIDATTKGVVLSAKLYTKSQTLWRDWFYHRWSLLGHE